MADTTTTTYGLTKPEVGASEDTWGTKINANLDKVDDLLDGTLPVTGIDINSGTIDGVTIGASAAPTVTNIDINGGSIDGTPIGDAAPAAATVTSLGVSNTDARMRLVDTDGTTTHNRTDIFHNADEFHIETRDNAGTFKGFDYRMPKGTSGATAHQLFIAGSEKVRVNSTGVGINTASPSEALHVIGNILASGNITAFSDIRLKADLQPIPDALAKVMSLTGYTYERIDTGARQTGVVAQEVQQVLPEAVSDTGELLSVAYGNMVGLLIQAIKELTARVEELEVR